MAFDRPIEADRIDDFNLFSAFVRAPLWILGGVLGKNESNDDDDDDDDGKIVGLNECDDAVGDENTPPNQYYPKSKFYNGQNANLPHAMRGNEKTPALSASISSISSTIKRNSKNLSWSDQSGRNLVEYNDQSTRHEPSPYSSSTTTKAPKPAKSALRRSDSVAQKHSLSSQANLNGDQCENNTRYIPKMSTAKTSLIMPTRPYANTDRHRHHSSESSASSTSSSSSTAMGGVDSPQLGYGFYMNLTPPTPEMYAHHSQHQQQMHSESNPLPPLPARSSHHNPVFQNLQRQAAPLGWTSVPI